MTQISFDGTYGYGPPPPLPVHLTDRGCLHWISHRGACTVSFDKIYILRMQPAHGEHITHQLSLGRGAGNGQSGLTRAIGIDDRKGSLEEGKDADIFLADENMNVSRTILRGRTIYQA